MESLKTLREKEAYNSFEMISHAEAKIRIIFGALTFFITLGFYLFGLIGSSVFISTGLLSFGLGAGITVYRSGIESQ